MWIDSPEISQLLEQLDRAQTGPDPHDPAEFAQLQQDLGRAVYLSVNRDPLFTEARNEQIRLPNEETPDAQWEELGEEDWYSDEAPNPNVPLFDPGELAEIAADGSVDITEEVICSDEERDTASRQLMYFTELLDVVDSEVYALHRDEPPWKGQLSALIGWRDLSSSPTAQSSQIQWICSDIGLRMTGLPLPVQSMVIGWLGAQLREIIHQIDDSAGPRLALERLGSYRVHTALPALASLTDAPIPETTDWQSDADAWLALLTPLEPKVES